MKPQPEPTPASPRSFTGRTRRRVTSRGVHVANIVARTAITTGGVMTILAVLLVCVFLVYVVVPLFLPGSAAETVRTPLPAAVRHLAVDDYRKLAVTYQEDGTLTTTRLDSGEVVGEIRLFDSPPTAVSFSDDGEGLAFGLADGRVVLGRLALALEFIDPEQLPPHLLNLPVGGFDTHDGGLLEQVTENRYRIQRLRVELDDPLDIGASSPILAIDHSRASTGTTVVSLAADGILRLDRVTKRTNILTGQVTRTLTEGKADLTEDLQAGAPRWLMLAGLGDTAFLVWENGRVMRWHTANLTEPRLAETLDLTPEPSVRLTAMTFQNGKASLVSGDSLGRVRTWFRVNTDDGTTPDGTRLVAAHELPAGAAAVTSLTPSQRTRKISAGFADGSFRVYHVTSDQLLAEGRIGDGSSPVAAIRLSPKDDAVLVATTTELALWQLDVPHPELTARTIFRPVWYEGYPGPAHVWQSSGATDDFEPKYGLMPLVFGTVKATLYSMLFGAPLALLAALFTSEFLHPRRKAAIKPTIELMASLPSVVLGFVAALVFAPWVEKYVPEVLGGMITVPLAVLVGAYLWQLLPTAHAVRLARLRLGAMALVVPCGLLAAGWLGRPLERLLFAGDIKSWLAGQSGAGFGGWVLLLLPLCGVFVGALVTQMVNPLIRPFAREMPAARFALLDAAKFLLAFAATIGVAVALAALLQGLGWDPRGGLVDTYVQRNALVVGFVMGFAIIPIIYTIAEDALSAVPEHLRAASLGAGATPWQTAFRIIIPTAMSGLFSALMIGLGRAVGETMIVLMAAGNTPVMEWNIFNGFRTLSANIAVELPEAVQHSTHYRMLFLAALSLFAITFVVNTLAEIIRLRFRRRSAQL